MTEEHYTAILHKNHGWIQVDPPAHFVERGKMVLLVDEPRGINAKFHYPYGTAWRASNILAYGQA